MILHYQTAKNSNLFHKKIEKFSKIKGSQLILNIDKKYQKIIGFGGAFTEAAAYTFYQMPKDKQTEVINAYFNIETGLGYNLGRVSINSCDFSLGNYTYVDDYDTSLTSFNINRDKKFVIPMIKFAEVIRKDKLDILASPWSPPAWMKTNNDMNHGGKLLDKYKQVWANYYIEFIKAYNNEGVNIFALSVQNEPAAKQVWDSCIYSKEEERDFVRDYLGPTLENSSFKDTKLLIWDHNRDIIFDRVNTVLEDNIANKYVWGIGFHWYVSEAFENLTKVHNTFPDKHLLFTEGTVEGGVALGDFSTGERYARNMIGDFNNYCEGYIEWNLMLNELGGPNHVGNYCDAPIIYNTKTDKLFYNSSYYAIGHFSKYIKVGAIRIASKLESDKLNHVAFLNPNGDVVIIVQNETETNEIISFKNIENANLNIKARSISTIIIRGEVI
ncbi:MAG: glycoside hydrolase family 30 protein [bacterium]